METTRAQELQQRYEMGFPLFKRLFEMPAASLKDLLKECVATRLPGDPENWTHLFSESAVVIRKIFNDTPDQIEVNMYDQLIITPYGISFKPERGHDERIANFDQFFTL